jgi:ATP-dependent DNA helicase RecQ
MLTFSRAAATEFKKRLVRLIGNAANFIEIKTFHSYCFDLLGRLGHVEKFEQVIKSAIEKIQSGEVEQSRITKTVLVIDEAQDMDQDVFALVQALMAHNEDMRVIAVGDDDQNIFEFRGSSSRYLAKFMAENKAVMHELLENYRSKRNLVAFSNKFAGLMRGRFKKNEIIPHSRDNGVIRVFRYANPNLLVPFTEDLAAAELVGSTCVLTHTNDEALQVTGLLLKKGIPARLIQTNDGFQLYDLIELRYFMEQLYIDTTTPLVSDDVWNTAKRALLRRYGKSEMLDICKTIIRDFEAIYPNRKYKTDFEVFIRESKLEDFYQVSRETIFVSTIHKAKGKEFDNVFLLLENFTLGSEEQKRQLYVAITRAKSNLTIHLKGQYLNNIRVENLLQFENRAQNTLPEKLAMQLSHRDVWLGYFTGRQHIVDNLKSGDILRYKNGMWLTDGGQSVLCSSKKFNEQLERILENGYEPQSGKVNFIVFWRGEAEEQEIKIVLPELHFERKESGNEISQDNQLFMEK